MLCDFAALPLDERTREIERMQSNLSTPATAPGIVPVVDPSPTAVAGTTLETA